MQQTNQPPVNMSGSGGFYKYRCKYFYTHNCQNWVWVNKAACASCLVRATTKSCQKERRSHRRICMLIIHLFYANRLKAASRWSPRWATPRSPTTSIGNTSHLIAVNDIPVRRRTSPGVIFILDDRSSYKRQQKQQHHPRRVAHTTEI